MKSNGLRSFYLLQNGLGWLPGEQEDQTIARSGAGIDTLAEGT